MSSMTRRLFVRFSSMGIAFSSLLSINAFGNEIRVGISLPTQRDVAWVRYKQGLETAAKKLGVKILMQVSDQDASVQAAQVENLLSQKVNVLIIAPQDAAAAGTLIDKAHKAGIKVISLDRLILNSDLDLYISFDNSKIGELQGQYLAKNVPKGNYVVFLGAPTDNNSKILHEAAMKHIEPLVKKGDVKIVMEQNIQDWQPSVAQRLMENSLTANKNNINAVLAPNDNTAGGIIQALASQKLAGKVYVTGQDSELTAAQRIIAGTQSMTIYKDQNKLSELVIQTAKDIAENKPIKTKFYSANGKKNVPSIFMEPIIVDKYNIDKEFIESGFFKKEDVYKFKAK
ncbi:sugar ABC transporter substrate-binding protein [Fluviispira multicolorata]|uniref:Substrate-binding domain-containing protein n=1 Tax=Fluviispira multicolorata TaxID=2654512 RepID=A0A833JG18_9BACT|nr:substrate-binding domain-containing protein [Fluviispira multicolorata]KAB8031947.1 substrate-binding domain-containing protein [Fluviispira multicolorata]